LGFLTVVVAVVVVTVVVPVVVVPVVVPVVVVPVMVGGGAVVVPVVVPVTVWAIAEGLATSSNATSRPAPPQVTKDRNARPRRLTARV